jgi:hypothetical protein
VPTVNRTTAIAHELAHALLAKRAGRTVRLVVTLDDRSFTMHSQAPEPVTPEGLADSTVIALGGRMAAYMVHWFQPPDDAAVDDPSAEAFDAAMANVQRLSSPEAGAIKKAWSGDSPGKSDKQKAAGFARQWAELTGADDEGRESFLTACETRALVELTQLLPIIHALTPLARANPFLTGDDLDAGLAELEGEPFAYLLNPLS